ncbi:beta-phosphoglucomutase [Ruminiclostridium cellulolyticum]|uniref:Beta-phosphoglucomutase n=1 Tax=Ruminiclostridium cellulolyticum (strain ATCC 35319 / DSM 5812 / JCM 6584 / H10) TaxID=394503 RepID=B8I0X5_RUMCH|nr:beta-phosphoglucomutase [Ruminiclostridium cellulolyticum]ACL77531.1 beta-phosphoglucomutase [Ruminiclostridium cellulolyticum H10]
MKPFKAAIFDLDGVIVDTAKFHFLAWHRLAAELGFEFTEKDNERQKGVSRMESLEVLLEVGGLLDLSSEKKEELATKKNEWYKEYLYKMTPAEILPGAKDFLKYLRLRGIRIALASASKNAPIILEKLNITDLFDAIVDGNSVSKAKPNPEVFLKAAEQLGIAPSDCFVFEDAQAGVEGAKRAGMRVVGIGEPTVLNQAEIVVRGFPDIEPVILLSHIN